MTLISVTPSPARSRRATRSLAALLLAGLFLGGESDQSVAQGIAGHNSDAPVDYFADRVELQDKAKRVVLSGNVDIRQGALRLQAQRTTVAYTNDAGLKLHRIDATGGVFVSRGDESARGDVAVYDVDRNVIVMTGHVALRRAGDTLNGDRLSIDLDSGLSTIDGRGAPDGDQGSARGRVSGSFKVEQRRP